MFPGNSSHHVRLQENTKEGAEEMVQGVMCLSRKLKGLTSIPRTHVKRQVWLIPALGLNQQGGETTPSGERSLRP